MKKYQTEFKVEVVESFLAGEGGAKLLARRWGVPEEEIRSWVSRYRLHGIDGLSPKRSAYSFEFKQQVLSHQNRERLSSRRVAAIYDIRNPNQVVVWRRSLAQSGSEGLESNMPTPERKPERHCSEPSRTVIPDSTHALREENERLRAQGGVLKKGARLDPSEEINCADKARLILGLRHHHRLADLLQASGLARSTFYYQCKAIQRIEPSGLEAKVRAVYDEHKGRYGYRRITSELCHSLGACVNHKRVQRLMQKMGLRALIRAKKRPRHSPEICDVHVPNILKRDFVAKAPNEKWATDITEFNVNGQKLYLSACMDLYNGEIIAHRMARRPVFDLVAGTLDVALARSRDTTSLTVHSDQGWHYKMQPYRAMLAHHGVTQSMSRRGNCFDNAVIESFFGTLKAEYFYLETIDGLDELEAGVHDYIHYYNHKRIKLGLKGLSPVEYRLRNTA